MKTLVYMGDLPQKQPLTGQKQPLEDTKATANRFQSYSALKLQQLSAKGWSYYAMRLKQPDVAAANGG